MQRLLVCDNQPIAVLGTVTVYSRKKNQEHQFLTTKIVSPETTILPHPPSLLFALKIIDFILL